uniref:Uncharacterized protein n=1 Tax=Sinocyclocheilus anshuiensis TaxID=1608454 RepID=A0A671RZF7_9TELE
MAFFGITYLGYQNPFGDRMLTSTQNQLTRGKDALFTLNPSNTHILNLLLLRVHVIARTKWRNSLLISDISVRSCACLSAPKELYRVPVTDNQQYGWWVSSGGLKKQEPWTQTRRFPRKNSIFIYTQLSCRVLKCRN